MEKQSSWTFSFALYHLLDLSKSTFSQELLFAQQCSIPALTGRIPRYLYRVWGKHVKNSSLLTLCSFHSTPLWGDTSFTIVNLWCVFANLTQIHSIDFPYIVITSWMSRKNGQLSQVPSAVNLTPTQNWLSRANPAQKKCLYDIDRDIFEGCFLNCSSRQEGQAYCMKCLRSRVGWSCMKGGCGKTSL